MISEFFNIHPKDITIVYLKGRPEPNNEKLTIKFGDTFSAQVLLNLDFFPYAPYFNMKVVKFPKVYLGDVEKAYIRVCNELPDPLYISWNEKFAEKFKKVSGKQKCITNIHEFYQVNPVFENIAVDSNALFKFHFSPKLTPEIPEKYFQGTPPFEEIVDVKCLFRYYEVECSKTLTLHGTIIPPAIQFEITEFHLNQIYIGERHCFTIRVCNEGIIPGKVRLQNISTKAYLTVQKEEFFVNPEEVEEVFIQYFGKEAGKFVDTLTFKIGFGPTVVISIV